MISLAYSNVKIQSAKIRKLPDKDRDKSPQVKFLFQRVSAIRSRWKKQDPADFVSCNFWRT